MKAYIEPELLKASPYEKIPVYPQRIFLSGSQILETGRPGFQPDCLTEKFLETDQLMLQHAAFR